MKPHSTPSEADDLFRARLDQILDRSHALVKLADAIDWEQVDHRVAPCYADDGRPGLSPRLMVGLHYLKHAFDESDESVCERWVENPYWQYFCGAIYLQHVLPIDPSSMTRWRDRVGPGLFNDLLHLTLRLAVGLKQATPREFREVVVDTTVQEKAIAHPTDARLYDTARSKLVDLAKGKGIALRQSYARKGPEALRMHGRYAALDHLRVERLTAVTMVGGDEVDAQAHRPPEDDLMVEFGVRPGVEAGEAVDEHGTPRKAVPISRPRLVARGEVRCMGDGWAFHPLRHLRGRRWRLGHHNAFTATSGGGPFAEGAAAVDEGDGLTFAP